MHSNPVIFLDKILSVSQQPKAVHSQPEKLSINTSLEQKVIAAIRTVYDPEIHVNVFDLGLIYNIRIDHKNEVEIDMTLTAPACPVAEALPALVAAKVKSVEGIQKAKVNLVWNPPWSQAAISEAALLELGLL